MNIFLCIEWLFLCHLVSDEFSDEIGLDYLVAFLLCILFTPVLMWFICIIIE